MLGLGLGLKLQDFTRVLKTPKDFIVGFISQLIILPLVSYLLIIILKTPPEIAIGVMIIAAAPGGVTSNIMTKFAENFVASKVEIFNKLNIVLFAVFFFAAFYEERENLINLLKQAGLIALILNVTMMIIAFYLGKVFASGVKQLKCIALECGLQNGTLALFVSTQIFGSDILYAIPTGAYALIMYITGFTFVFLLRGSAN